MLLIVAEVVLTSLIIGLLMFVVYLFALLLDLDVHIKRAWKAFISARPKSGIDKEISEEEKEIAELERQKEKIDTLAYLKRRKDRLFNDVHGRESWDCEICGEEFETLNEYANHSRFEHPF